MSQGRFTEILDSGRESNTNTDLHLNQTVYEPRSRSIIVPMRLRRVEHDPVFAKIADDSAVFQDVICLSQGYRKLVDKILKNLHCRLIRKCPKRPHWYFPWRKREELDIGFRLFVTYQLGKSAKIYNTHEVNEANWFDIRTLFYRNEPGEAVFCVDWWIKGERMVDSVECWKDAGS